MKQRPAVVDRFYDWLQSVSPSEFMKGNVSFNGGTLKVFGQMISGVQRVRLLAYGKASLEMTKAFLAEIGEHNVHDGVCVTHCELPVDVSSRVQFIESSHPFVSELSICAGQEIIKFAERTEPGDVVVVLVSGGGSAMIAAPIDGLDFPSKQKYINELILRGVGEREVNVIRKALSKIKGGKLADLLAPAKIVNLIVSDEREHKLTAIASGCTVRNDDDEHPSEILDRFNLRPTTSPAILKILDARPCGVVFGSKASITNMVVAKREMLIERIRENREQTYDEIFILEPIPPMPFAAAVKLLWNQIDAKLAEAHSPGKYLFVCCGEIPVVPVKGSKGGRNQHLALAFLRNLALFQKFVFTAVATDGCDFIKGVHGAWVDHNTLSRAKALKLDLESSLEMTQSYEAHAALGTLIEGGFTGTNVSDFYLLELDR